MKKTLTGLGLILILSGCNSENSVEKKTIQSISNVKIPIAVYGARGFGVADIDEDGDLDMVHSDNYGNLYLNKNDGNGNYITSNKPIQNVKIPISIYGGRSVALGDYNNDGKIDILTTNKSGEVKVFLNNGNFSF